MRTKEELQNITGQILHELRKHAGITKAKMAVRLNVDERTYARYESGESAPSLSAFIAMLDGIDAPALPIILRYIYPDTFGILGPDSPTSDLRRSVAEFITRDASDRDVRQLAYIVHGPHGSPLAAQLQLFCALDHLPMDIRLVVAKLTLNAWEIASARNELINPDHIMPDAELLRSAIIKAQEAVVAGRNNYNTAIK